MSATDEQLPEGHEPPRLLKMIGVVAAGVAVTILIFFVIGYIFGRLFL